MSELEFCIDALRRIFDATRPPHYSREARRAHAMARDALKALGRAADAREVSR